MPKKYFKIYPSKFVIAITNNIIVTFIGKVKNPTKKNLVLFHLALSFLV